MIICEHSSKCPHTHLDHEPAVAVYAAQHTTDDMIRAMTPRRFAQPDADRHMGQIADAKQFERQAQLQRLKNMGPIRFDASTL